MLGFGHQKHHLDIVVHGAVHADHLKLVFEIRNRSQAADDHASSNILSEMHQQVLKWQRFDHRSCRRLNRGAFRLEHLDPLFEAEERPFITIDCDADHKVIHQLGRPPDDIQMPARNRVESARVKSFAHDVPPALFPAFAPRNNLSRAGSSEKLLTPVEVPNIDDCEATHGHGSASPCGALAVKHLDHGGVIALDFRDTCLDDIADREKADHLTLVHHGHVAEPAIGHPLQNA